MDVEWIKEIKEAGGLEKFFVSEEKLGVDEDDEYTDDRDEILQKFEAQIRKAASLCYDGSIPGYAYDEEMTLEELDELCEGINLARCRDVEHRHYLEVNLGFGGGNHASYYFPWENIESLPEEEPLAFYVLDGHEVITMKVEKEE